MSTAFQVRFMVTFLSTPPARGMRAADSLHSATNLYYCQDSDGHGAPQPPGSGRVSYLGRNGAFLKNRLCGHFVVMAAARLVGRRASDQHLRRIGTRRCSVVEP